MSNYNCAQYHGNILEPHPQSQPIPDTNQCPQEPTPFNTEIDKLIRSGTVSERNLKLKYLQARDNWFNNACETTSSFDDVVSVYCKGLPTIFNEYKNYFGGSSDVDANRFMSISTVNSTSDDCAIISSWLLLKASIFIASLEVYLDTINQGEFHTPSMVLDTMTKCFELTKWLSSIGFDFGSRLKPLFYKALMKEVRISIERATIKFETNFTTIAMKSIEQLLLPIEDEIFLKYSQPDNQNLFKPPKSIENYPVFNIYCLHLIDSLEWLRITKQILSPVCLCFDTYSALNASMTRVMKALSIIMNIDNNSSHPIVSKIALSFVTEVLPNFVSYCEGIFPEKIILASIGLSKAKFKQLSVNQPEKVKNFMIDLKQIADPLKIQF